MQEVTLNLYGKSIAAYLEVKSLCGGYRADVFFWNFTEGKVRIKTELKVNKFGPVISPATDAVFAKVQEIFARRFQAEYKDRSEMTEIDQNKELFSFKILLPKIED